MRKQYHCRRGTDGLDAWDVDRLIESSRHLPVEEVSLSGISELDSDYWFAGSEESPTVRKVAEHAQLITAADLSYPVILGADGRVMDGMHRVCKALIEGRSTVPAVRLTVEPPPDYRSCRPDDLPY
jgi:hypothetical protein